MTEEIQYRIWIKWRYAQGLPNYAIIPRHLANHNDANHDWLFCHVPAIGNSRRKPQEKRGIFAIWENLSRNHTCEIARRSIESNTSPSRTQRANDDAKQKARKAAHGEVR